MNIELLIKVCNDLHEEEMDQQIVELLKAIWSDITAEGKVQILQHMVMSWMGAEMHEALCMHCDFML